MAPLNADLISMMGSLRLPVGITRTLDLHNQKDEPRI